MRDPFEGLAQSHAAGYLRRALESGNVTHAYLICGPAGCGHEQLALHLAAALVADGDDQQFDAALRQAHPDVHVTKPASSAGYLVDQVRDIVHDATLAPVRASSKVYVVCDADRMKGAPANAFLKTLEEPPQSVRIIMLASAQGAVLNTIRSRCQVLSMSCADMQADDPAGADNLALAGRMLAALGSNASNRTLLAMAKDLVAAAGQGIDDLKDQQAQQLKDAADYLSRGAQKDLEQAHKREVTMQQRAKYMAQLVAFELWLRDCMMTAANTPQLAATQADAAQGSLGFDAGQSAAGVDPEKEQVAHAAGYAGIIRAIEAVADARHRIACNVTPQLAFEAMLFEIREALCPR